MRATCRAAIVAGAADRLDHFPTASWCDTSAATAARRYVGRFPATIPRHYLSARRLLGVLL